MEEATNGKDFIEYEGFLPGNHQTTGVLELCDICGVERSKFSTFQYLEHFKKHGNPQEQCSICQKICGTKYQLLKHKHNVHGQTCSWIWSRYKVKKLEDPQHGENLLAAVLDI